MEKRDEMYKSVSFSSLGVHDSSGTSDWRKNIDVPVLSQVGGRKGVITLKKKPIIAALFTIVCLVLFYNLVSDTKEEVQSPFLRSGLVNNKVHQFAQNRKLMSYNRTYPLTKPVRTGADSHYRIGLITDMDTESKASGKSNSWHSLLKYATLSFNNKTLSISIKWNGGDQDATQLVSGYANGGRGMELSELAVFNAKVYSVDDRTGIIYQILTNKVAPWVILSDGDGKQTKGFKGEWMAIKDEKLFVGGLGKEWTTATGEVLHNNPQWIKTVDKDGSVSHFNWVPNYKAMQKVAGCESPGYIIHESAVWSDVHKSWFFLPRRASHEKYDEDLDEYRATNLLFKCSEDFSDIKLIRVGKLESLTRGFSSFKFIPGTQDRIILALKTEEVKGKTKSFITAFTVDGEVLLPDQVVSNNYKYEGVEFL
uniref:Soluble calcium-activated nucleotidase 1 n=1 Tax=Phallusia mammillata TaxID=59560 RepID=A0A6F9D842_9ASCI|nr:soluble calcium-activated nucleotidase 1 [Phallusia mammillata]